MSAVSNQALYKVLTELEIIEAGVLEDAYKTSQSQDEPLADILLEKNLIRDENIGQIISDLLKIPFIRLSGVHIPEDVLQIIPEVVAKKQQIIAFKKDKQGLHLAMADPNDNQMRDFVAKKSGLPLIPYFATKLEISEALGLYAKDFKKTFEAIVAENLRQATTAKSIEPPIIKIVDTIIEYSWLNKSSDVHLEPFEKHILVRFRIDGVLHDIIKLPADLHPQFILRIKVLAKLRTDEHQAPQDGKIAFKLERNGMLDLRVSIVPTTNGEKVVMRLLSERSRQMSLEDLGLEDEDLVKVKEAYQHPHGMILATGPTGSGKTTTLYGILKLLNRREVNIATIEDPVEYSIEGVNQIQVNTKTKLTFARGLRSIVRQDPDIILVGEIRDEETAGIAINSALTGHLVLSSLHTNDAATTFPRLLDMKIESFLVASTVNVVIAQRLVRKICFSCRMSVEIDKGDLKHLSKEEIKQVLQGKTSIRAYRGKGCSVCHDSGYVGRVGIFEVLSVDDTIRQAIVEKKDAAVINELAIKAGMRAMIEDGLKKVKLGVTTLEEVLRVTKG